MRLRGTRWNSSFPSRSNRLPGAVTHGPQAPPPPPDARPSGTSGRLPALLIAAALALATLTWTPAALAGQAAVKRGKQVGVFVEGDSLTVGSGPGISARLRPVVKLVRVDAATSRFTADGIARVSRSRRAKRSRVWVMALGTNDGPSPTHMKGLVLRALRVAGKKRHVVWVTIQRPGDYSGVNRMLRRLADRRGRLHVVDWARHTNRNPHLLAGDRVHGTSQGYRVRARMITREARRVARHHVG